MELPNENQPHTTKPSSLRKNKPLRETPASLRQSLGGVTENIGRRSCFGLDPKQAISEWLEFAKRSGHIRVTGQRAFDSDLERIEIMDAEAESLFLFARDRGLTLSESIKTLIDGSPMKIGNEHKVFRAKTDQQRVFKITHPGKYGRREHTPFQYLERWSILNEIAPTTNARLEDCIQNESGELAIIISMAFYKGPHPGTDETHEFIKALGFEILKDGSTTLDYFHTVTNLIIRDCHPKNWIKTQGTLVPIDIIPENYA